MRIRPFWSLPGEPIASLYTPEWRNGMERVAGMRQPAGGHFAAFFAQLEQGWEILRPLQLAAEAVQDADWDNDVAAFICGDITDNFRFLALGCLQVIPPFGPEPPIDEIDTESEMLARNVRVLGMARPHMLPSNLGTLTGPAAEAITPWQAELVRLSQPVIRYVVRRWQS